MIYKRSDTPAFIRTAHHKAGHAVIAYRFREHVREGGVTIDAASPGRGHAHLRPVTVPQLASSARQGGERYWKVWCRMAERDIVISLGGPLAELRYIHGRSPAGCLFRDESASDDVAQSISLMKAMDCDGDLAWWMFHDRTRRMLREPRTWRAIRELAGDLINKTLICGKQVDAICERCGVPQIAKAAWTGQNILKEQTAHDGHGGARSARSGDEAQ